MDTIRAKLPAGTDPAGTDPAGTDPAGTDIELWWQDEARVGQKNKITRRWAPRGSRPCAPHDQRTKSAYIFGAICPDRGVGAALVLPRCNTQAMQWHLDEISSRVTAGAVPSIYSICPNDPGFLQELAVRVRIARID